MMVKESSVNNNLVYRSSRVGVPRHTTSNRAVKPFFVGCAQIRKLILKAREAFLKLAPRAFCMRGGQMVVKVGDGSV